MSEKRFTFMQDTLAKADVFDNNEFVCCTLSVWVEQLVDLLNELNDKNKRLKQINKGQELEIKRLHNLADRMSGVLRELGIYDVYDNETIEEIKNKVKGDMND